MFPETMTLKDARDELKRSARDGVYCPCCSQLAKVYRRKLNHQNVRVLHAMFQVRQSQEDEPFMYLPDIMKRYLPDIAHQGGHATIAAYWGLIVEAKGRREDGGRAGWWALTQKGVQWLHNEIAVPKYAETFDSRVLALVGEPFTVLDAVGTYFDYDELMRGV